MKLETKFHLVWLSIFYLVFSTYSSSLATDYSSTNFSVKDPVITSGLQSSSSANFGLGQSLGQTAIGKSTSSSYQLWSGFQYFFKASANTLTATAGNGQVALSWSVPTTFLGVAVGGYDVGVGTVSGSYTFESAGNVTNYTKTGLSNGTTYYFKIKAKTAGGTFLVFSNEASAAPSGATAASPGATGGGGSSVYTSTLTIQGLTSPGALVTTLKDGLVAGNTNADQTGLFEFTLGNVTPGTHNFTIFALDKNGVKTANTNLVRNFSPSISLRINDVFLAPTLLLSHIKIKQGEPVSVSGFTAPNAAIAILLGPDVYKTINPQPDGYFQTNLQTASLKLGWYLISARASKGNLTSSPSSAEALEVSTEESIPTPKRLCGRADLNCDGRINLIDFSILLYYWLRPAETNAIADINQSGFVDLVDFSIMLYEWTG